VFVKGIKSRSEGLNFEAPPIKNKVLLF
jgi:hypothetical protein